MIGLLVFLICLLIIGVIVKMLVELFVPGNANAVKIAMLIVLLFAILWLAGFGGWGSVYGWRMHP